MKKAKTVKKSENKDLAIFKEKIIKVTAPDPQPGSECKEELHERFDYASCVNPVSFTIDKEYIQDIIDWDQSVIEEKKEAIRYVQSALITIKKLREDLLKNKHIFETIEKKGFAVINFLTTKKAFFGKDPDCALNNFFLESSSNFQKLDASLEKEIKRLQKVMDIEIVTRAIKRKLYQNSEPDASTLEILDIVQETGLSLETIVRVVNHLIYDIYDGRGEAFFNESNVNIHFLRRLSELES